MVYGIISAMEIEIEGLRSKLSGRKTYFYRGQAFTLGRLGGHTVVAAMCGVGKVNAAMGAQALLAGFKADALINLGVAAGGDELRPLDLVLAEKVCQHDVDTTAVGDPPGFVSTVKKIYFPCDEGITNGLMKTATALGYSAHQGVIASGDQFIGSKERKEAIINTFGAKAIDMEAGSIGQVCYVAGVPFASVRAISDGGDGEAAMSYQEFKERAAKMSIRLVCEFLFKQ